MIIPAYNEERRIRHTLARVERYLERKPYATEIIVVDDGSKDRTVDVVLAATRRVSNMRLVQHVHNRGKGWAVRSGMLRAIGRYRLFMDADYSTPIDYWDSLYRALESDADIAIGSRHVPGSRILTHQALHRELLGSAFRYLVRSLVHLPIKDTQNGFKAFTAEAAENIFKRQSIPGWAFDVEVLSIGRTLGYSMEEVPVDWRNDDRSRVRLSQTPRMLADLLRVRFKDPQTRPRSALGNALHALLQT